ncbi:MAG TPA: hypothetical protein VF070_27610 [Streptosporangiaceae bacterium]
MTSSGTWHRDARCAAGYDLRAVAAWVTGADPHVPEQILTAAGARQWALALSELRSEAHKTTATVRMVMSRAFSFMADPALAASVLPGPGEGFDIPAFLAQAGTVYMIAEAISQEAPVAPLFAAMASEITTPPPRSVWLPHPGGWTRHCSWAWTRSPRSAPYRCPPGCPTPAAKESRLSLSPMARPSSPTDGATTAARSYSTPPR